MDDGAKPQAAYAASLADVAAAAKRIAPYAHRTPVMTCSTLDAMAGRKLYFKCEHLQKIGAFKFRGACNAVMKLDDDVARRGVVTHSSGNHAQALALAAKLRGIESHIVMPRTASRIKRAAVGGYGGRVILCEPDSTSREGTAAKVQEETGATLIHPYNHPDIIAGQGTCAMELLDEVPQLDAIITPVGGGGLLSGTCIATRGLAPHVKVFAGEPLAADDAARSIATGELQPQPSPPKTIADGLLTALGPLTFAIIRDHVTRIITVTEDEIVRAMRLLWQRAKLLVEPSSAVALAAVLSDEMKSLEDIDEIGIILSGGNVDIDNLPW